MGNSATKEQRPPLPQMRSSNLRRSCSPPTSSQAWSLAQAPVEQATQSTYSSRQRRGSRSEISTLLGIAGNSDRESSGLEARRETKPERDAKRLERERVVRERERERSIREENVDGGYLVTQGVYTGIEDYNKVVVRQLMIERRVAPFWRGLNDHSCSWTENQLVAVARGLPLPTPDEIPAEDSFRPLPQSDSYTIISDQKLQSLTVPISSRSQSYNSDSSSNLSPSQPTFSLPSSSLSGSALLRGRAKTLASLTTLSKTSPQPDMMPREMHLPKDPYVNGQPIEAYLYKDASECPICFLYYPPYLNQTRCCDQAICSECFVQIKRPDPHPPEHANPTAPLPPTVESSELGEIDPDAALISEPAACPFCVQPEFGVTYEPPPFRRGLTYVNQASIHSIARIGSAMSSSSSIASVSGTGGQPSPTTSTRRRTTSLSANAPTVITTDRVRPDWATKLSSARAHAARRSAAATALHTAAYLIGTGSSSETRSFGGFGRRGMLRRGTGADSPSGGASSAHLNMLALMSERYTASTGVRTSTPNLAEGSPAILGPPRESSRRNRMDDLEDMMMVEAIRLSLASEEERRKREEKDAKKEAKKKVKEGKKAEKLARKAGVYQSNGTHSSGTLDNPQNTTSSLENGKGKEKAISGSMSDPDLSSRLSRSTPSGSLSSSNAQVYLERSRAQLQPNDGSPTAQPYGSNLYKPSHLRTLSNASSSASSMIDHVSGYQERSGSYSSLDASPNASGINLLHGDPSGGEAGTEMMFNFRSLAAMIGDDEKSEKRGFSEHTEEVIDDAEQRDQRGESSSGVKASGERKESAATLKQSIITPGAGDVPEVGGRGEDNGYMLHRPTGGSGSDSGKGEIGFPTG